MKRIITTIFAGLLLTGCLKPPTREELHGRQPVNSPCDDERLVLLRKKPIDSLSIREYDFMRTKEQECDKFNAAQNAQRINDEQEKSSSSPVGTAILITLAVVGTLYALVKLGL